MKRIYANLIGNWTDITEHGLIENKDPITVYKESWQDLFEHDYVNIQLNNKNYRIHPTDLQVVTE